MEERFKKKCWNWIEERFEKKAGIGWRRDLKKRLELD